MSHIFKTGVRFNHHMGTHETLSFLGKGLGAALYIIPKKPNNDSARVFRAGHRLCGYAASFHQGDCVLAQLVCTAVLHRDAKR